LRPLPEQERLVVSNMIDKRRFRFATAMPLISALCTGAAAIAPAGKGRGTRAFDNDRAPTSMIDADTFGQLADPSTQGGVADGAALPPL
jgi:hypothetical protein